LSIENVFVPERHAGELQEGEYLQAIAIVSATPNSGG
jgi:hypothetical protein